jgi:hypothetical protein
VALVPSDTPGEARRACGKDAINGVRSGVLRCVNCYANWRWKNGGLLRRQLATEARRLSIGCAAESTLEKDREGVGQD